MASRDTRIVLPALRGHMGDWIYYSALIPMGELSSRVKYAHELRARDERKMSDFIQRALETTSRVKQIASYLESDERFFSSLVLAMYGGDPGWLDISLKEKSEEARAVSKYVRGWGVDSLGFLEMTGKEKIFALDGQHRLAGIKEAIKSNANLADELVSVLFVGHKNSISGNTRTRRLFTTLNKTAVKVQKKDIIALDEDDVMAIITRKLVETNDWFSPPKISLAASTNVPKNDHTAFTTIVSLYDTLKILFSKGLGHRNDTLRFNRPTDKQLEVYENYAMAFFDCLRESFPVLQAYFDTPLTDIKDKALRSESGGHILFRPIGLEVIADTYCMLQRRRGLDHDEISGLFSKLPVDLLEEPYCGLLWNPRKQSIISKSKSVVKRVIGYTLGSGTADTNLLDDYRRVLEGVDDASERDLPPKII
jgi:DNA sulfur modification protein DndB